MSGQSAVSTFKPSAPRFTLELFIGVVWAGFSLATIFVASRTWLRFKQFHRLFIDDAFVFFAWILALVTSILWQIYGDDMFLNSAVSRGVQMPPPDFIERSEGFLKASAAVVFLFYTTLWSIKLSFLFFFRRLYVNLSSWMRLWWAVLGFTIATWAVCVGNIEYKCLVRPLMEIASHCSGDESRHYQTVTLILNCVLDVVTDVMITAIPITMLWKVRISMRRKLALGLVFSVTVLTIIFAIARVSSIKASWYRQDITWLYIWSNIECSAALIVSSLGSFRSLFKSQDSKPKSSEPEATPNTIGSPPRKGKLDSIARIMGTSASKDSSTDSTHELVKLSSVETVKQNLEDATFSTEPWGLNQNDPRST